MLDKQKGGVKVMGVRGHGEGKWEDERNIGRGREMSVRRSRKEQNYGMGESGRNIRPRGEGRVAMERKGGYYLKFENTMFIPFGFKLHKCNMRCCSSNLCMASLWQRKGLRTERSESEEELK